MRKIVLLLLIIMLLFVGCTDKESEKQRYRVTVVEAHDDYYIVDKVGYTIGGIFYLTTKEKLEVSDIVYVIMIDDYKCVLFSEYMEEKN